MHQSSTTRRERESLCHTWAEQCANEQFSGNLSPFLCKYKLRHCLVEFHEAGHQSQSSRPLRVFATTATTTTQLEAFNAVLPSKGVLNSAGARCILSPVSSSPAASQARGDPERTTPPAFLSPSLNILILKKFTHSFSDSFNISSSQPSASSCPKARINYDASLESDGRLLCHLAQAPRWQITASL